MGFLDPARNPGLDILMMVKVLKYWNDSFAERNRRNGGFLNPPSTPDSGLCERAPQVLSLVSNETRLRILCLLSHGDYCVSEIADLVGGKYSNISQQLKMLTLAGCLTKERREKLVFFHLGDETVRRLIRFLRSEFGQSR